MQIEARLVKKANSRIRCRGTIRAPVLFVTMLLLALGVFLLIRFSRNEPPIAGAGDPASAVEPKSNDTGSPATNTQVSDDQTASQPSRPRVRSEPSGSSLALPPPRTVVSNLTQLDPKLQNMT